MYIFMEFVERINQLQKVVYDEKKKVSIFNLFHLLYLETLAYTLIYF